MVWLIIHGGSTGWWFFTLTKTKGKSILYCFSGELPLRFPKLKLLKEIYVSKFKVPATGKTTKTDEQHGQPLHFSVVYCFTLHSMLWPIKLLFKDNVKYLKKNIIAFPFLPVLKSKAIQNYYSGFYSFINFSNHFLRLSLT